jgi:hypothetical protein
MAMDAGDYSATPQERGTELHSEIHAIMVTGDWTLHLTMTG